MLHQRYPGDSLAPLLRSVSDLPYPTIHDREGWSAIPADLARLAVEAADALSGDTGAQYERLPATLFLQFSREGNRERYEKVSFGRRSTLESLVLAECVEDRGRFLDAIVDGVWAICEESFWGVPAHISHQQAGNTLPDTSEPIVDLFAAETANLLAWTHRLLGDRLDLVSPVVRPRIQEEISSRLLSPLMERDDFWWMGWDRHGHDRLNNWTPWIASNWLVCIVLMEESTEDRATAIAKAMRVVDFFVDEYPSDGGCDEGPSYWGHAGASLFEFLDLLHWVSSGSIDIYAEPLIRDIGRYIYRAHIGEDYYLNFADAPAITKPDPAIVSAYGRAIGDDEMVAFGTWLNRRHGTAHFAGERPGQKRQTNYLRRPLRQLFGTVHGPSSGTRPTSGAAPAGAAPAGAAPDMTSVALSVPLPRSVFLDQIQVMVARDKEGTTDGWFLGVKGGDNGESHNHNDVGSFVVYRDARPLIVDAGVETYTAKTFSKRRYELWTMQSSYHTLLPTVNGVQQSPGASFAATNVAHVGNDESETVSLDIARAYPEDASISRWHRSVTLERGVGITVHDAYALEQDAAEITFAILTPARVTLQDGSILLGEREFLPGRSSASGTINYDGARLTARIEEIPINDARLGGTWGDRLFRVVLTSTDSPASGEWEFRIRA